MDRRRVTTFEIEAIASPTPVAPLHANNRSDRSSTPERAGRGMTRWLVDAALCGLLAAALYGGAPPDPTAFDRLTRRPGARNPPAPDKDASSPTANPALAASRNGAAVVVRLRPKGVRGC
jgi:hypothetical protein